MINNITELLKTLQGFNPSLKTIVCLFFGFIALMIFKFFEDKKFNKYYEDMKNEKNKEIERLADDNRRYRDIYLKFKGIEQSEIDELSAAKVRGDNND